MKELLVAKIITHGGIDYGVLSLIDKLSGIHIFRTKGIVFRIILKVHYFLQGNQTCLAEEEF